MLRTPTFNACRVPSCSRFCGNGHTPIGKRLDRLGRRTIANNGRPLGFRLPVGMRRLSTESLTDLVWERMSNHATCTNGGHAAYCCPDGCHVVPFDRADDDEGGE